MISYVIHQQLEVHFTSFLGSQIRISALSAQAIRGSSFRAPLQGLNALAPSAAANFSSRLVAAAAAGTPSNDGASPVSVSLGPSSAPGGYTISATKQNTTSIQGPQLTDQVQPLPARRLIFAAGCCCGLYVRWWK